MKPKLILLVEDNESDVGLTKRALGGSIWVESQVDQGTTFFVRLEPAT